MGHDAPKEFNSHLDTETVCALINDVTHAILPSNSTLFLSLNFIFIYHWAFSHSLCSLPYGMSIGSSKANFPHSAIWCFLFQFPVSSLSLMTAGSCLCLLPRLPLLYILPSTFYSITCFRRQFQRKSIAAYVFFLVFPYCIHFHLAFIQ